jgi:signal transduction histidine kinase
MHFWFVKEAISTGFQDSALSRVVRAAGWFLVTLSLAALCFTEYFIPANSTGERRLFGPGYFVYIGGSLLLYFALAVDSIQRIRVLDGGRKLALQVWLWGGCAAAATILVLMVLNTVISNSIRIQPFVVMLYYAGTAYAITTYRVFDARQLVLICMGKVVLVGCVSSIAWFAFRIFEEFVPDVFALVLTAAICIFTSSALARFIDRKLNFYSEATSARQAAFAISQRESRADRLEAAYVGVLRGWGQSENALIFSGKSSEHINPESSNSVAVVMKAMVQLRWATPERLSRERVTFGRAAVARFLSENQLGVVVLADGPAFSVLVGVGVSASRRPYTYPQVTQLMELASIMESALERAHFSAKVQQTEQLATVGLLGASLAHEIRNPLVSIKTFVQLLPTHHQDPLFREKFFKLIGDEVGRIDQLTEQLLDLASPRTYEAKLIELHPLLRSSLDLVAAKASHRHIEFFTEFNAAPDGAFTDASAAKQVMLNLCFNAIQAVDEAREGGARWVKIATRNIPDGIEMAVMDSGPGIAPEIRPRLFQPFQTTKSSGFGLGLAICSDILGHLNARIAVDPPVPGQGATFRVTFPCQPSSS